MTNSSHAAIDIVELTRTFGSKRALDNLTLQVPEGSVFGFLGPNGAGKSTTLGILSGLDRPTSGTASILGHEVVHQRSRVHAEVGYLPDFPNFYPWMTSDQYLRLCGEVFELPGDLLHERIATVLDLTGLTGVDTQVGGFSRGMRQRLGIAQALINAPRVLLLDEPTSALDPVGRRDVLEIIQALRGRTTVFFSTHILADVERTCDHVAIIDHGRVILESDIDGLRHNSNVLRLDITVGSEAEQQILNTALKNAGWLIESRSDGASLAIRVSDLDAAQRDVPVLVGAHGLQLIRFQVPEPTLEDVFINLVGSSRI